MNKVLRCAAALCCLAATQAGAQLRDAWSPKVEWQQPLGMEVTPFHIVLMPNGRLFLVNNFNYLQHPGFNLRTPGFDPEYAFVMDATPAGSPLPASLMIQPLPSPAPLGPLYEAATNTLSFKTVGCSGHALTADGKLFFAGGALATIDMNLYTAGDLFGALRVDGIAESFTVDPSTLAWTRNADSVVPGPTGRNIRWYPTVTKLADSRMLLTGGFERVLPDFQANNSVEVFDPARNAWTAVSRLDETPPGLENPDYPHVWQLPYSAGDGNNLVLMIGGSGEPMYLSMNGTQKSWTRTENFRPNAREFLASAPAGVKVYPNQGSSSAMLPIRLPDSSWGYGNGSVIQVGGWVHTAIQGQIDVYDPVANAWRPTRQLGARRVHPATVLLPDGRVLVLGGHDGMSAVEQTGYAEYIDPKNGFAVSRGSDFMPEIRAYHSVAVLLPDGRVFLGSGNVTHDDAKEEPTFRYYSPDYTFKARPQLTAAPDAITIGEPFAVMVPHGTRVAEAALMALGAMTHSFDQNQRNVQLAVFDPKVTLRAGAGAWSPASPEQCRAETASPCFDLHVLRAPPNAETAPRGHYMLFLLDEERVPSEAKILRLQ